MQKLLLILLISLPVFSILAQDKKQDPPRGTITIQGDSDVKSNSPVLEELLYKAPKPNELKEFIPENKAFSIIFPGTPTIVKEDNENGSNSIYRVNRQGGGSSVIGFEFKDVVADKEWVYELTKNNLLTDSSQRIQAEKDILIEGRPAKEIDVVSDYQFLKVRVLIIENRVYHIINILKNWRDLNEKKVVEFKKETTRFFNSFKLTNKALQKKIK